MPDDPWQHLRQLTPARIALGRAGGSLPTAEVLRFAADHAAARDAVHAELDVEQLKRDVGACGLDVAEVTTRAADRAAYLKHPDLGRQLSPESERALASVGERTAGCDVALVAADGLSALACQRQVPPVLAALVPLLRAAGLTLAPLVVARQARVAVQDRVGAALRARASVVLIGERPGLGTADSLGAYLVFDPRPGRTDADRNCVSNIRPAGLPPAAAADAIHYLVTQALARRISGVELKDDRLLTTVSAQSVTPIPGRSTPP
ncbi:MAG TPA: ethanolamine ammonia-lyase subunit EutC [Humisphaera sp.]